MGRMLCVFLSGVLLSGFLDYRRAFAGQEPAVIGGDKAVRFEQSPGFFHYAALCRTLTESTHQIPAPNLPPEITEPAVCWYVKTVVTRGSGQVSPEADGKLVISAHHVLFVPRSMQYEDLYVDLPPDQVQLDHQPRSASRTLTERQSFTQLPLQRSLPGMHARNRQSARTRPRAARPGIHSSLRRHPAVRFRLEAD